MSKQHIKTIAYIRHIKTLYILCVLLTVQISALSLFSEALADDFDVADKKVKRLSPDSYKELPRDIIKKLVHLGCSIPQSIGSKHQHNVIAGEFARQGQKDWAILCSIQQVSSVRVFWGGDSACSSVILTSKDRNWLQNTGRDIQYSRMINPVNKQFIVEHSIVYGKAISNNIRHQGIEELFVGKGSTVHYCENGKWKTLPGAD